MAGSIWGLGMFWNVPEWERASPGSFRGWGPARLSACLQGRAPARTPAPRQPSFYQAGNWFCDLWNVDRRNPYIACLIFSKLKRNVLGDHFQNKFLSFSWRQTFKQGERCSKFLKFLKLFKFEKVEKHLPLPPLTLLPLRVRFQLAQVLFGLSPQSFSVASQSVNQLRGVMYCFWCNWGERFPSWGL